MFAGAPRVLANPLGIAFVVAERGRVDEEAIFGSVVDPFLDDVRAPDARFLVPCK